MASTSVLPIRPKADLRFILKEKSASHWTNSLEQNFPGSGDANGIRPLLKKGEYPFTDRKLEIVSHDFLLEYMETYPKLQMHYSYSNFIDQQVIDLAECKSIQIAPAAGLKSSGGALVAKIGKGLPGQGFLPARHSKADLANDKSGSPWQAHSLCHRPLIVCREVDREMTDAESRQKQTYRAQIGAGPREIYGKNRSKNHRLCIRDLQAWADLRCRGGKSRKPVLAR